MRVAKRGSNDNMLTQLVTKTKGGRTEGKPQRTEGQKLWFRLLDSCSAAIGDLRTTTCP